MSAQDAPKDENCIGSKISAVDFTNFLMPAIWISKEQGVAPILVLAGDEQASELEITFLPAIFAKYNTSIAIAVFWNHCYALAMPL